MTSSSPTPTKPPPPPPSPPKPSHGGASSSSSSTSAFQACAVCKYQRRRCTPDCKLAPYFPAHKQKEFLNAHKLFGVHNIVQILDKVPENQREDTAASIIIEADARARDPVMGCLGVIRDLERRIEISKAELQTTLGLLDYYRRRNFPNSGVIYDGISINHVVNHVANQEKKPVFGVGNMLLHEGSSSSHVINGCPKTRYVEQNQELLVGVDPMEQFLNISSGNEVQMKGDDQGLLPHLFLKN